MKKLFGILVLLLFNGGDLAYALKYEYVPQVREGVEWGYCYGGIYESDNIHFFRLQFEGTTEINGKEYHNLYRYDTFFLFSFAKSPIAWMREEDKKVYAILNPEYKELERHYQTEVFSDAPDGAEMLLMDYGLYPGQSFEIGDGEEQVAVCLDVESVIIGNMERKMFTLGISEYGIPRYSDTYKFVEGIGPISTYFPGKGSFIFTFNELVFGGVLPTDSWLYEREVLPPIETDNPMSQYTYIMGDIISKSPIFDYVGIHDPTIWYWSDKYGTASSSEISTKEENGIQVTTLDGGVTITSSESPISSVQLFHADGTLLKRVRTSDFSVRIPSSEFAGRMLVMVTTLANGRKDARKIVSRL